MICDLCSVFVCLLIVSVLNFTLSCPLFHLTMKCCLCLGAHFLRSNSILILLSLLLQNVAEAITSSSSQSGNETFLPSSDHYFSNDEIASLFQRLEKQHPLLAKTYTIGKSVQGRDIHVLRITSLDKHDESDNEMDLGNGLRKEPLQTIEAVEIPTTSPLRPIVKMTANIHGDEVVGREMILYLAQYLLSNYNTEDQIQSLVNNTEIHLLPSANPDGFAVSKVS